MVSGIWGEGMGDGVSGQAETMTKVKENTVLGFSYLDCLTGSPQTKRNEG